MTASSSDGVAPKIPSDAIPDAILPSNLNQRGPECSNTPRRTVNSLYALCRGTKTEGRTSQAVVTSAWILPVRQISRRGLIKNPVLPLSPPLDVARTIIYKVCSIASGRNRSLCCRGICEVSRMHALRNCHDTFVLKSTRPNPFLFSHTQTQGSKQWDNQHHAAGVYKN